MAVVKSQLVILGGGISGLAAHHFAARHGISSILLEKTARFGGWIDDAQQPQLSGGEPFLFSGGPRSLRVAEPGPLTLQLIDELGLTGDLVWGDPLANRRLLLRHGQVTPMPYSLRTLMSNALIRPALVDILREPFVSRRTDGAADESVLAFFERRFGPYTAQNLVSAIVQGIYASDPRKLSVRACFPQFPAYEDSHGSVLRGAASAAFRRRATPRRPTPSPIFSLRGGLTQLVNTLVARAAPQTLFQRVGDVRVELSTPAGVTIRSSDGRVFQAQHLLSSIPPSDLVSSCPQLAPYPSPVSRYTSLAVINVTFESPTPVEWLPPHLRGFGYLIPPPERDPLLGVIFDSFTFREHQAAPADRLLRLTVMIGGDPDLHDRAVDVNDPQLSDEALINIALAGLRRHLPSLAAHQPAFVHLKRCSQAIPCYDVGHNQRLAHFEGALAEARLPVTLIGNLWGVGVNHCILRSQEQIRQLAQNEKFVPAP